MTISAFITSKMVSQNISHTWKTTIQSTIEGGEKRSAIYTWPRVKSENGLQFLTDEERRFIRTHLYRDIHHIWGFPLIHDKTTLSVEAASGQKVLTVVATGDRHFYDGRDCILFSPTASAWQTYEQGTIDTVDSGTQITLEDNLTETWPAETLVFPLYPFHINNVQELSWKTRELNTMQLLATESFETDRTFTYSVPLSGAETYNGLDLFLYLPRSGMKEKFRHPYSLLGFYGKQTMFSDYDKTRFLFSREYPRTSRADIWKLLNFFDSKQGRLVSFYTPTWANDIVVTGAIDSADQVLTVKPVFLTSEEIVGRHVYIRFPDGTYACRQITNLPASTTLVIDSAIGTSVAAGDLSDMLLSFLYETRFNSDEIMFEYITKDYARTKLSFNSIW